MKKESFYLLALTFFITANCFSQLPLKEDADYNADTATVNQLLKTSKEKLSTSPDSTVTIATKALEIAERIEYEKGKALALKNIGNGYYFQGKFVEALDYWNQSLALYEKLKDEVGISNLLNNIASVYSDQGDDVKALECALRSLSLAEKINDKLRILSALNTIANIYYSKAQTKDKALDYLLRALPLCEEIGDTESFGFILENIGEIYYDKDDDVKAIEYYKKAVAVLGDNQNAPYAYNGIGKVYLKQGNVDEALKYHNQALSLAEKLDVKLRIVESLQGLANVYIQKSDFKTAISYYKRAEALAVELKFNPGLKDIYMELAGVYEKVGDYKSAYAYQARLDKIKDTLFNELTERKLGALQFEFDLQKKQGVINLLTKDKAISDQKLQRQRLAKNAFMIGLALVFMIALLIYRNYLIKVRTHKILDRQKDEIEGLLLNILPATVAKELQVKGHAAPRYYESVSVMFTDFKGFTLLADKMTPQDLVEELNTCFKAFDDIIGKNNLEKIKTIGDSYMCAGGIPTPDDYHVENMIKAGLEIRDFTNQYNNKREKEGLEPWHLRIGIHMGPVVAGVVGKKKYAYDIWGSTVNIASRMESNGVAGEINVSSTIYKHIRDKYNCIYRGKINAKNIGEIDMYLVESGIIDKKQQHEKVEEDKMPLNREVQQS